MRSLHVKFCQENLAAIRFIGFATVLTHVLIGITAYKADSWTWLLILSLPTALGFIIAALAKEIKEYIAEFVETEEGLLEKDFPEIIHRYVASYKKQIIQKDMEMLQFVAKIGELENEVDELGQQLHEAHAYISNLERQKIETQ